MTSPLRGTFSTDCAGCHMPVRVEANDVHRAEFALRQLGWRKREPVRGEGWECPVCSPTAQAERRLAGAA